MANGTELHWREIDAEFLAYDEGSGHTFAFPAAIRRVLERLSDAPATIDELVDELANAEDISSDNIGEMLNQLAAARIIARVNE